MTSEPDTINGGAKRNAGRGREPSTLRVLIGLLGPLISILGLCLLPPLLVGLIYGEYRQGWSTLWAFLVPALGCLALGPLMARACPSTTPSTLQASLLCSLGWLVFSAIGAVPFMFAISSSFLDGLFEAMSGFTTTGITMYTGLDHMPRSIIFWRSWTQLMGGMGILTMFLATGRGGHGGHQLFGAEGHKIDTARPVPGLVNTTRILWGIYLGFTAGIAALLTLWGMPLFDSLCHAFSALATGGFSPYDASIEAYRNAGHPNFIWLEYILVLGMTLGGMNFVLHFRVVTGRWRAWWDSAEVKAWWLLLAGFTALIMLERGLSIERYAGLSLLSSPFWVRLEADFRTALFQVVSIITTTGFGTKDIAAPYFGELARILFLVMMVIGGCVGSTGGGIKVLRLVILHKLLRREVFRLQVPSQAVSLVILDGEALPADEIHRVSALFFAWMALLLLGGVITETLSPYTGYQAMSGMASALGNVGPCYIPYDKMMELHPVIKLVYILGMLAGRLEILPVLLLFSRRAWR